MVAPEATNELRESGPGTSLYISGLPLIKLYLNYTYLLISGWVEFGTLKTPIDF